MSLSLFALKDLNNMREGRPNLGPLTPVAVYRLMQYTFRDVLEARHGSKAAREIFFDAGALAGKEFCKHILNASLDFDSFVAQLQQKLKDMRIGVLRVEKADKVKMEFTLTVEEDLDCSGLPLLGETVCDYDEGFIAGVLHAYSGKEFEVKEIDCWATGERVCRFSVKLKRED